MNNLMHWIGRILFVLAVVLTAFGVWERLANAWGYTVFRGIAAPWRFVEMGGLCLLFVIAIALREMRQAQIGKSS